MEEKKEQQVTTAQEELSQSEVPQSLDEIVAGLKGFGIEENEEILTIVSSGKKHRLRISNIPTEEEMLALLASENLKGYLWVQRMKVEILSRAISWIDGRSLRNIPADKRIVTDPTDNIQKDYQVVLRNVMLTWGQELLGTLWKILMVHSDKIEKRLQDAFPDSVILTDYEKRFMQQAMKDIEDATKDVILDSVQDLLVEPGIDEVATPGAKPEKKKKE